MTTDATSAIVVKRQGAVRRGRLLTLAYVPSGCKADSSFMINDIYISRWEVSLYNNTLQTKLISKKKNKSGSLYSALTL